VRRSAGGGGVVGRKSVVFQTLYFAFLEEFLACGCGGFGFWFWVGCVCVYVSESFCF
jgi:hypothetical protein